MMRQRAGTMVERSVRQLRADASPMSEEFKAWARDMAAHELEQDAHDSLKKDAPAEAWAAICNEYRATLFYAGSPWPQLMEAAGA